MDLDLDFIRCVTRVSEGFTICSARETIRLEHGHVVMSEFRGGDYGAYQPVQQCSDGSLHLLV